MSGTQTTGGSPNIAGPKSASVAPGAAVALPITVTDTHWPYSGKVTAQVACAGGTVSMTLNGQPVSGSGTDSITMVDTPTNVKAALATLSYTAAA